MLFRAAILLTVSGAVLCGQKAQVSYAEGLFFPGVADSNSPIHWSGGKMYAYNSDGLPIRSEGADIESLRYARATYLLNATINPWWIEATYKDDDGTLYGWYHHEIYSFCDTIEDRYVGVPVIGAVVSYDNGRVFYDLGFVLADGNEPKCEAKNGYFAGGHGDFSVILDREKKYFYFFFSSYGGPQTEQGVAVARMAFDDRGQPVDRVWKYLDGEWASPGLYGRLTPIFTVRTPWDSEFTDAYWGPSVHYNRELGEFVMLVNHACCVPGWPPEGIYISFNGKLDNPKGWGEPEKIINGGGWYPMVVGEEAGDTDKEAGARARFFMGSDSFWELTFKKGETGVVPLDAFPGVSTRGETRQRRSRPFRSKPQTAAAPSASTQSKPQ